MRDICNVIEFLNTKVIPEGEPVKLVISEIARKSCYLPPESQADKWYELYKTLHLYLDQLPDFDWKTRVSMIMTDKEKIPVDWRKHV